MHGAIKGAKNSPFAKHYSLNTEFSTMEMERQEYHWMEIRSQLDPYCSNSKFSAWKNTIAILVTGQNNRITYFSKAASDQILEKFSIGFPSKSNDCKFRNDTMSIVVIRFLHNPSSVRFGNKLDNALTWKNITSRHILWQKSKLMETGDTDLTSNTKVWTYGLRRSV